MKKKHPMDRDLSPGLRFPALDMTNARQLVEHLVQSTAMHSRSRGWLPGIKLDLYHRPLAARQQPGDVEKLELVILLPDFEELMRVMEIGMERAKLDAEHGLVLPEEA